MPHTLSPPLLGHLPCVPVVRDNGSAVQIGIGAHCGLAQMAATGDARNDGQSAKRDSQRFTGRDDMEPAGVPDELVGLRFRPWSGALRPPRGRAAKAGNTEGREAFASRPRSPRAGQTLRHSGTQVPSSSTV